MTSSTSETISGSSAEVGSSKSMSLGRIARARAIAARCCWPPDNWAGYLCAWLWIPTRSSRSMACASACAFGVLRTLTGPSVTFCKTVLCANRLNDWNTMPTSARCRASSRPSAGSGLPSKRMRPESMGSSRLIVRHRVDLPPPEGPTMTRTSPRAMLRLTARRTCRSPKLLPTFSRARSGWAHPGPGGRAVVLLFVMARAATLLPGNELAIPDLRGNRSGCSL